MDKLQIPIKNVGQVSDSFHTFDELYDHRIALFIALCAMIFRYYKKQGNGKQCPVWRSRKHSDNSDYNGWFIMGIHEKEGEQITYHLPEKYWEKTTFARTLPNAPEWDKHTSADVLDRLTQI